MVCHVLCEFCENIRKIHRRTWRTFEDAGICDLEQSNKNTDISVTKFSPTNNFPLQKKIRLLFFNKVYHKQLMHYMSL